MTEQHVAHPAGYTQFGDRVWKCLICDYQATYSPFNLIIVNAGDPNARHAGPGTQLEQDQSGMEQEMARLLKEREEEREQPWWTKAGIEDWLARGGG